jgi:hypothetical protein
MPSPQSRFNREIDCLEIARRFFSKRESEALREVSASDRQRAFFACWTRNEARISPEFRFAAHCQLYRARKSSETDNYLEVPWRTKEHPATLSAGAGTPTRRPPLLQTSEPVE